MKATPDTDRSDPVVAILAGGKSSRMGRDKASLRIGGETFLERTAGIATGADLAALVIGRPRPEGWPFESVPFLEDDAPDKGPLGGLVTALRFSGTDVLLLACDMPDLSVEAIRWLHRSWQTCPADSDGLVVLNRGRPEPLFSVYASQSLAEAESILTDGTAALRDLIAGGSFRRIDLPPHLAYAVRNVNTPDQFRTG